MDYVDCTIENVHGRKRSLKQDCQSYNVPKMEEKEKVSFIIETSPTNYELCKKIVELRGKLKIIMFLFKISDNHFISCNHRTL